MPKPDVEISEADAKLVVKAHEHKHGRDMTDKIPPGTKWGTHDVPSQAELDEEPGWHKQGKKRSDLPDDLPDD